MIRLVTNSVDSRIATVSEETTTQSKGWLQVGVKQSTHVCVTAASEKRVLLLCSEDQRPLCSPDGRHAGIAFTAGEALGGLPW